MSDFGKLRKLDNQLDFDVVGLLARMECRTHVRNHAYLIVLDPREKIDP